MAEQELDLVQFPSRIAAQTGAGPAQVMRGKVLDGRFLGAFFHDMPDYSLRYTLSHVLPARQTQRNTRPSVTPPDASQESIAFLTQSGTGTVRT